VVSSHHDHNPVNMSSAKHLPQVKVYRLRALNLGEAVLGVPNNVSVSEVGDDQVIALLDPLSNGLSDLL
jgi:hypothetical protein